MDFITELEREHPAVGSTELWQLCKEKVLEEKLSTGFLEGAGTICAVGIKLSKDIIRFFDTYTLHDETHIVNVCNWMMRLLGEKSKHLSAHEAVLLAMSACCHDIGMSVSVADEKNLAAHPDTLEWKEYFKNHYSDENDFCQTGIISRRIMKNYVRSNHHRLVAEKLDTVSWPDNLLKNNITRPVLISLCQSHGQELEEINCPKGAPYDLHLCAVLLRLADILDFDSSRAPEILFRHLGLDNPGDFEASISQLEWMKNRAGTFGTIRDGVIPFTARFSSLQLEYEVRNYLDWVRRELVSSCEYLSKYSIKWRDLDLPREISTDTVEREGYQFGRFCITLDQDRVIQLFTGENLYNDPGVFVRELLQNAVDAVLLRKAVDAHFKEEGRITIHTWTDRDGRDWFRIEDNGVGMNEEIIENYFLKAGRSYYTSEAFKAENRRFASGSEYQPISRFGIGILSCFMSDPENTLLEVSTKRYSQDITCPNPAIRMDVTGLHGYYYLAREDAQSMNSAFFKHMHHPTAEKDGYRTEPGTTICVQTDLGGMGEYRSFREILDKYIHFPEITIEHFGPEGYKSYPTQQQLMDAAHALPSDAKGRTKPCLHPIPDRQFEKLKQALPDVTWNSRPLICLEYVPLDRYSSTGNISGVAVFGSARISVEVAPLVLPREQISYSVNVTIENDLSSKEVVLWVSCNHQLSQKKRFELEKYKNQIQEYYKSCKIRISYNDLLLEMGPDESTVFQYMLVEPSCASRRETIAYRGILAENGLLWNPFKRFCVCELLLGGTAQLDVCLSRDFINSISLETECELTILQQAVTSFTSRFHFNSSLRQFSALTERVLQKLLEKHPRWETYLQDVETRSHFLFTPDCIDEPSFEMNLSSQLNTFSDSEIMIDKKILRVARFVDLKQLYDWIWIAAVKRHTTIYSAGPDTSDFPAPLFCMKPMPDGPLGYIEKNSYLNYYNSCHRFSRWLIQHQAALQTQKPSVYHQLINNMLFAMDSVALMNFINDVLVQLKGIAGNPFDISDRLFLKEADFFGY